MLYPTYTDLGRITTALACFQLPLPHLTHLTMTLIYFSHALPDLGQGLYNDTFLSYIHGPDFEIKYEFGVMRCRGVRFVGPRPPPPPPPRQVFRRCKKCPLSVGKVRLAFVKNV
jgi:hypothetical protein